MNSFEPAILARKTGKPDPILYFYEDFLQVFDPVARERYGVYYTPVEVVTYMVAALDRALRDNLGTVGLTDETVTMLDPATGTGTFQLGVIEHVRRSVESSTGPGAVAGALRALSARLFGFELLVGPYAVAHYRLRHAMGALQAKQRVGVFLADTLAEPGAAAPEGKLGFVAENIRTERHEADRIKQRHPILAIIVNPPYRRLATGEVGELVGNWMDELWNDLKEPVGDAGWANQLNTFPGLSIAFWRWAIWKIFESEGAPGRGVVAFISNRTFLAGKPYAGLRAMLRERFNRIEIIDLRGDVRRGERAGVTTGAGPAVWCHGLLPDYHAFSGRGGYAFPLRDNRPGHGPFNISPGLLAGLAASYGAPVSAEDAFDAMLALLSATSYTLRFAEDLEDVFPHVPFPSDRGLFLAAAELGREIRAVESFGRSPGHNFLTRAVARVQTEATEILHATDWTDGELFLCANQTGRVSGISAAIWSFSVSGYRLLPRWLTARQGLAVDHALISAMRDVVGRIAALIDLFARADTLLIQILPATLTKNALGLGANETANSEQRAVNRHPTSSASRAGRAICSPMSRRATMASASLTLTISAPASTKCSRRPGRPSLSRHGMSGRRASIKPFFRKWRTGCPGPRPNSCV